MKRIALVLLAATALIAAGCGSNKEDNDYVNQVNKVNSTLNTSITKLSSESSTDPSVVAKNIEGLADTIDKAADDLDAIDEPDKAKKGHGELVAGTRKVADEFRAAAKTAESDPSNLAAAVAALASGEGSKEINQGFSDLKDAGFKQKDK